MDTLDQFEQFISDSQRSACILGNLRTSDFELISLSDPDATPGTTAARRARGLIFLGVVALQADGTIRSALDAPLPDCTVSLLAQAFVAHVAAGPAAPKDDAVDWLTKLHQLPDPRES